MAIEVQETFHPEGHISATITGGRRVVRVWFRPAQSVREEYNPSMGADYRAGSARIKTVQLPAVYLIAAEAGPVKSSRTYPEAVKVAVRMANQK